MAQIYKIHCNRSLVYLAQAQTDLEIRELPLPKQGLRVAFPGNNFDYGAFIEALFHDREGQVFCLAGPDWQVVVSGFIRHFTLLDAGGGVGENGEGRVLVIYRRGWWDLPKGKMDEGETIENCALREVEEETGLTGLRMVKPLPVLSWGQPCTFHTYGQNQQLILKRTWWFVMRAAVPQSLELQAEEDITDARWVNREEVVSLYAEMYSSIADVLQTYFGTAD